MRPPHRRPRQNDRPREGSRRLKPPDNTAFPDCLSRRNSSSPSPSFPSILSISIAGGDYAESTAAIQSRRLSFNRPFYLQFTRTYPTIGSPVPVAGRRRSISYYIQIFDHPLTVTSRAK